MNQEKRETAINQSFDLGHEMGRNEIFRQVRDIRASQKAHERKVRRENDDELGRSGLYALAVAQLKEIDEILSTEFNGVYKEQTSRDEETKRETL